MKTYPNDTAHPVIHQNQDGTIQYDVNFGLTKREHFAAMAMQGMASSDYWSENFSDKKIEYLQKAMEIAVKTADELINQLNK